MINKLFIITFFICSAVLFAKAQRIERIADKKLTKILNSFDEVKMHEFEEVFVRVFLSANESGSAKQEGTDEVSVDILIAISEYDEYPAQSLFTIANLLYPEIISFEEVKGEYWITLEYDAYPDRKKGTVKIKTVADVKFEK